MIHPVMLLPAWLCLPERLVMFVRSKGAPVACTYSFSAALVISARTNAHVVALDIWSPSTRTEMAFAMVSLNIETVWFVCCCIIYCAI